MNRRGLFTGLAGALVVPFLPVAAYASGGPRRKSGLDLDSLTVSLEEQTQAFDQAMRRFDKMGLTINIHWDAERVTTRTYQDGRVIHVRVDPLVGEQGPELLVPPAS